MTTRQEQVMIVLYGQIRYDNGYEMPYETTQYGISDILGISRGHVSVEIKRLEKKNLVTHLQRHAYSDKCRSGRRMMCYKLTPLGINEVKTKLIAKGAA